MFHRTSINRHKFQLAGDRERWSVQAFPLAGGWLGNMLIQGQAEGLLRFGYHVPDRFQASFAYIFWGKEFEGQEEYSKFGSLTVSCFF